MMKRFFPLFLGLVFSVFLSAEESTEPAGASVSGGTLPSAGASSETAGPSPSSPPAEVSSPVPEARPIEEQRRDTLRFGTETEIAGLIQTLKNEKVSYLDGELVKIAQETRNRSILAGAFSFFGDMEKTGLEDRAIRAIKERDEEADGTVMAAVDYLGKIRAQEAVDALEELINSGEARFLNAAFRALGRAGQGKPDNGGVPGGADAGTVSNEAAFFLLDYYNNRNPPEDSKREIIVALGGTGSKEGVSFLAELAGNNDERAVLRMAALDAIAEIGDPGGLDAVIGAVSSTDPNVRSSAVAALGPFTGEAAENAVLEGFRDSYYRTRIGAAQAAGKRRLTEAIPYLRYRAENDDVPAVKDEAIRALGAINNSEANGILGSLFSERKNADRVRVLAADMLLRNDADTYSTKVAVELDEAKNKRQTPLYNGFIRVLSTAESGSLEDLARRLISGGGIIEKSLALDLVLNNEFRGMADAVRALLDEKKNGASLTRKARNTLEKLGLDAGPAGGEQPAATP